MSSQLLGLTCSSDAGHSILLKSFMDACLNRPLSYQSRRFLKSSMSVTPIWLGGIPDLTPQTIIRSLLICFVRSVHVRNLHHARLLGVP